MSGGGFVKDGQDSFDRNRALLKNAKSSIFEKKQFRYREPTKNLLEGDPKLSKSDRDFIVSRARAASDHHYLLQIGKLLFALACLITLVYFLIYVLPQSV